MFKYILAHVRRVFRRDRMERIEPVAVLVSPEHVWLRMPLPGYVPDPVTEPNSRPGCFEEKFTPEQARREAERMLASASPELHSLAEALSTAADHVERHGAEVAR